MIDSFVLLKLRAVVTTVPIPTITQYAANKSKPIVSELWLLFCDPEAQFLQTKAIASSSRSQTVARLANSLILTSRHPLSAISLINL